MPINIQIRFLNIFIISLMVPFFGGVGASKAGGGSSPVGSVLSLNADFDIYKIDMIGYKNPVVYYEIMPAPEHGVGGRDFTYFGRMPRGTTLQVVKAEKGKGLGHFEYWAKPLSPVNGKVKGNTSRKPHIPQENLDEQVYKLSSIASNVGLYEKGHYSNGAPKLSETWFTLIKLNE